MLGLLLELLAQVRGLVGPPLGGALLRLRRGLLRALALGLLALICCRRSASVEWSSSDMAL
ncbi:MAG: hypothetical protein ACRDLN_11970 [Solirubrobacteraceae bacterium]